MSIRIRTLIVVAVGLALPPAAAAQDFPEASPAALRAFNEGMERYVASDWRGSIEPFYRAYELDFSFAVSLLFAATSHWNAGEVAAADSLLRIVSRDAERLSPYYRHRTGYLQAIVDGDNERAHEAVRRQAAAAPGTKAVYNLALNALRTNRPREAVRALTSLDPERDPMRGWMPYWSQLTRAYHVTGDHELELEAARRARAAHPGRITALALEAEALAALGRVDELQSVLDEATGFEPRGGWTVGSVTANAAVDLRAHGHEEAARMLLARAIEWYERRAAEADEQPAAQHRNWYGWTLYNAGRWEEAKQVYEGLASDVPDNLFYRAVVASAAARRGDRERAKRMSEELAAVDRPYLNGANTFERARISAALGDAERAATLLRRAFAEGRGYPRWLHRDPDFGGLRGEAAFAELLVPRG